MLWTVHSEKPLYQDEWLDLRVAHVELPGGRHIEHRLMRTRSGAGCVVLRDGEVLLLWRHRFITGTWGWEIPVGKTEPGEDTTVAAARETEEETGWRPGALTPLLRVEPTPGISDSVHQVYLAEDAEHIGPPADPHESERISWIPLADIPALVSRGEISAASTVSALLYMLTRPEPGALAASVPSARSAPSKPTATATPSAPPVPPGD